MAINAGELRNRVQIQVPYRVRGAGGKFTVYWAALRNVYCKIENGLGARAAKWRAGKEIEFSAKTKALATNMITIRKQQEWLTPDMRLVERIKQFNNRNYRVFNIVEAIIVDNLHDEIAIAGIENISDDDSSVATYNVLFDSSGNAQIDANGQYEVEGHVVIADCVEWDTGEIDFTSATAHSVTLSDRFFIDSIEILCTQAGGTVNTQPTFNVGITGSTSKYLSGKTPTSLTAAYKRQSYNQLLANEGESTSLVFTITNAGAVSAGNYKGVFIARGHKLVS